MRKIVIFLMLSLSAGCTSDTINIGKQSYNNSTEIFMNPVPVIPNVLFSLYWNNEMGPEKIVMKVTKTFGGNLSGGESLHFIVDGKSSDFASFDLTPEVGYNPGRHNSFAWFSGHVLSSRRYLVPSSFVKKILRARTTLVRVDSEKEHLQGRLSDTSPSFRVYAADFVQEMERNHQPVPHEP